MSWCFCKIEIKFIVRNISTIW